VFYILKVNNNNHVLSDKWYPGVVMFALFRVASHVVLLCFLLLVSAEFCQASSLLDRNNGDFWRTTKKGANVFNRSVDRKLIRAAKQHGIQFFRLSVARFPSQATDFLVGNADDYVGLEEEDVKFLRGVLDLCLDEGMPVVLTMLTLPGSRWKDLSWWETTPEEKFDIRIWKDVGFQEQAARFWRDVALKFHDHPAIVGFNLLNEPYPEKVHGLKAGKSFRDFPQDDVQKRLFKFYDLVIKGVRSVTRDVPIILDSSWYADAEALRYLIPHDDPNLLYSVHIYEPYNYTNFRLNGGKYKYPGKMGDMHLNKKRLLKHLQHVSAFQKANNIRSDRIIVGEFGGDRRSSGLSDYFTDLISIFKEYGWHFAFYAFRPDSWDGMDYELGEKKLPWAYWEAFERGEKFELERRDDHAAFKVLKEALQN